MKALLFSIILAGATSALGAEQQLPLQVGTDGQPQFGIQYAYDVDVAWNLTFASSLSSQALASLPRSIFWNLLDTKTGQPFAAWTETRKNSLQVGSFGLSDQAVLKQLLPNMKTAKIVFAMKTAQGSFEPLFSLPLGSFCQQYPTHFTDLTHPSRSACTVTAADLPDLTSECEDLQTMLLDFVKRGLLTCKIAQDSYANHHCGVLSCH